MPRNQHKYFKYNSKSYYPKLHIPYLELQVIGMQLIVFFSNYENLIKDEAFLYSLQRTFVCI